jgi:hypothetical protein
MRKFFTLFASLVLDSSLRHATPTEELDVNIGLSEGSFEVNETQLILDKVRRFASARTRASVV